MPTGRMTLNALAIATFLLLQVYEVVLSCILNEIIMLLRHKAHKSIATYPQQEQMELSWQWTARPLIEELLSTSS